MKNPYLLTQAKIEKIISETSEIKTFVLKPKESLLFATGQFIELTVPGLVWGRHLLLLPLLLTR